MIGVHDGGPRDSVRDAHCWYPLFIAFAVVAMYVVASKRLAVLWRHAVWPGLLYGIAVYLVMNLIVLPLSAIGRPTFSWPVVLNGILIHMFGVGLPSSLFARATAQHSHTQP
jgi:uncharacterized membrane protein YagU involved in acid resistance